MINNQPVVSVVVNCARQGKYLRFLVNDLLRQEYPAEQIQIILVGSDIVELEHTEIQDIVTENANIEYVRCKSQVIPVCYNQGIQQAEGEIIILLDNQTRVKNDLVAHIVAKFQETGLDFLYGSRIYSAVSDSTLQLAMKECLTSKIGYSGSFLPKQNSEDYEISSPFGCYKRNCFEEVGYFSEILEECYSEDFFEKLKHRFSFQFCPDIWIIRYVPDELKELSAFVLKKCYYRPYLVRNNRALAKFSHTLPFVFLVSLLILWFAGLFNTNYLLVFFGLIAFYAIVLLIFSAGTYRKYKRIMMMGVMPYVFFVVHGAAGWG